MNDESTTPSAWLESAGGEKNPIRATCSIGRSTSNHVVLTDDKVSRRHAMINAQGHGEFWMVDLGSSNGTYVNGRRVAQPCRLNEGDVLEIGNHRFTFRHQRASKTPESDRTTEKTIQDIRSADCWLLVADLEDSTQFHQKLPADQVPRFTGRWLANCKQIVEDHNGAINKFLGDGFFAYWTAREHVAASVGRAVHALQELQKGDGPKFRIVLHLGKVFLGGEASLGEESLMGTEVNFVFRMEKVASQAGCPILISESAHGALNSHLIMSTHGRHAVPSFDGEFQFFTV